MSSTSTNGIGYCFSDRAQGIANYPHCRRANGLIFVSGISSRRLDNTYVGVTERADGGFDLDIREQTRAVLDNIAVILARVGASLDNVIDVQVFLVDMKDYPGMNEVYNEYFDSESGPSRTTVAVHQLPNPAKLLVEIKVIALDPSPEPAVYAPAALTAPAAASCPVASCASVVACAGLTSLVVVGAAALAGMFWHRR
ncbi:endoribonuclease L-PSP [Thecamonas trahens ATCC 50062]|uniref:Endoribonuclease L-PSP n=1 Tax=Thecamonas trahens ATCC 50062 TaxID=461836 RepID=A0A0L0D727_THETB|nr:endoribonuclease L-PSP [Thecamonas trahens ATCC 50062]KNC47083.1 endoribonuclease L-PSP [Thecamonas trahens ATCC 50062]|eukprot:XP_013759863.1 endoribonuclease L-PSP [Thecamonas trahens ATCC 50062]